MLNDAELIAFAGTTNPDQTRDFYEDVLGLEFVEANPFALVFRSGGTMLRIAVHREFTPPVGTVLGWKVDDIHARITDLTGRGVQMLRFDGMEQDEQGVWQTPDGAKIAWFKDPDGNVLSLTEFPG